VLLASQLTSFIAFTVLLLILLALVYKYRRHRRVQTILIKYTPFNVSPYSKSEKKRSSMGADLLFWDDREPNMEEKGQNQNRQSIRQSLRQSFRQSRFDYGSTLPGPVTLPNPTATPVSKRSDGPPVLNLTLTNTRPETPTQNRGSGDFVVSPMSANFPRSPSPTFSSPRNSQGSLGGVSIASSGVISPSLFSWPMPPSTSGSVMGSPPVTSHGYASSTDRTPRFKSMRSPQPAPPSNWQRPENWVRRP